MTNIFNNKIKINENFIRVTSRFEQVEQGIHEFDDITAKISLPNE